ncbi:TniQ family protein [Streptomyces silvisoli]|uniref:TniQ family protein n=1 Tax=Streptomyces silvisoli TaxID=3034235 RepID=A0ABT5ZND8_9ACTN|nr:TniQ family protein [Streptomyces silvisoli]MDF3291331.1 TniQ family protein [Streptomyces silvisoli]
MNEGVRTLPIRLPPLPGEALDSWLEALARRLDSPLGDVLRHFGLPARSGRGDHLRGIPTDWTILLDRRQAAAIAHASGLGEQTITGMTLAHYDGRAIRINFERRYVNRWVLWGRGAGSRFCPDCLTDSGGRWPLFWRLGWAFACPRHHRLLADCCPNCGRIQRRLPRSGRLIPGLGICGNPPSRQDGDPSGGCGFDLTETETPLLPAGHAALIAQDRLLEIIDSGTASFGAYIADPQPTRTALADIRAVGGRVLADLPADNIRSLVPADIADMHLTPEPDSRLASRASERPGFMAPPRAVSAAVAVIAALRVLEPGDVHEGGEVMRSLLEAMRERLYQISPRSIDTWGKGLSPVLHGVYLAALAPSFRTSEQLRFRTPTTMPSRPKSTSRAVARRARKVPSTFWPSWAVRLTPSNGIYPRTLAPVLASSLLIVGSCTQLTTAAGFLGSVTDGVTMSRILQALQNHPHWQDMVTALLRLVDYLDAHDVPIDYQRRRRLDYTRLLPHARWLDICRRTGTVPGSGPRERIVRCQLFQRISGLPAEAAPDYPSINEARFRAEVARFAVFQTPELAAALVDEARYFLAAHRVRDEPVTWQPPMSLLAGLELPGSDPAHIDVSRLHTLIRQHKNPVQHAAKTFGTSIRVVRHLLDEHPAPAAPLTKRAARATGHIRFQARQAVPKETFTRLYQDEHRSLKQIEALTGFSSHLLTTLAREYGIPLRDGPQDYKRWTVERDWLIEQYVIRQRSLTDLADETGMSRMTMSRWAHTHNIPVQPGRAGSHNAALRAPDILRKAFSDTYAWQRVERFLDAVAHPTLYEAAQTLAINYTTLTTQIARLEQELGQPLLERAERGRAMQLTPFGQRVTVAARKFRAEEMTRQVMQDPPAKP